MYDGFRIPQVLGHWKKHVEQTILTKHVWLDYGWRLSTNLASGTLFNFVIVEQSDMTELAGFLKTH